MILRRFVDWNIRRSLRIGEWTNARTGRRDGLLAFRHEILPKLLRPGLRLLDVGGGKWPLIDLETKRRLGLHVTAVDISADELAQAPHGAYDEVVVGDVAQASLPGDYDLIVSQFVLEHVADTPAAIANLTASLAPGGRMAHFLPCSYAGYTFVSRLLGNRLGRRLLWMLYPGAEVATGFRAYYHRCTPGGMRRLCEAAGAQILRLERYHASDYFRFCLPLYCLELARQHLAMWSGVPAWCETFALVAEKPAEKPPRLEAPADRPPRHAKNQPSRRTPGSQHSEPLPRVPCHR